MTMHDTVAKGTVASGRLSPVAAKSGHGMTQANARAGGSGSTPVNRCSKTSLGWVITGASETGSSWMRGLPSCCWRESRPRPEKRRSAFPREPTATRKRAVSEGEDSLAGRGDRSSLWRARGGAAVSSFAASAGLLRMVSVRAVLEIWEAEADRDASGPDGADEEVRRAAEIINSASSKSVRPSRDRVLSTWESEESDVKERGIRQSAPRAGDALSFHMFREAIIFPHSSVRLTPFLSKCLTAGTCVFR